MVHTLIYKHIKLPTWASYNHPQHPLPVSVSSSDNGRIIDLPIRCLLGENENENEKNYFSGAVICLPQKIINPFLDPTSTVLNKHLEMNLFPT